MLHFSNWKKAWAILDAPERRSAFIVLAVVCVSALSSAVMVGSIFPFLSVLADVDRIQSVPLLAWAYHRFGFSSDYSFIFALGLMSLFIIISSNLLQILRAWSVAHFALMRTYNISHGLFSTYLSQDFTFFLNRNSSELSTQVLSESAEVVHQFFRPAAEVVASSLTVLAVISVLIYVDPLVAGLSFSFLGGVYAVTLLLIRQLVKRKGEERSNANRARFKIVSEAFGGVKQIKLLGREKAYIDRFKEPALGMSNAIIIVAIIGQLPQYVLQALGFSGIIILCLILLDPTELASGSALGDILPLLGIFAFGGQRLIPELSRLYAGLNLLNAGSAAVENVYADLQLYKGKDKIEWEFPEPMGLANELRLDRISYRYPGSSNAGLHDLSLTIKAGEKIGVIGSTGAGKTTLADVILGLLSPDTGHLVVDGEKVTKTNLRAWQQSVGYVPQNIYLTDASVRENIALGILPQEIDNDSIYEAARIAQIDAFIEEVLPQGYDTIVGEQGIRISGGQRQRIGIARALYHNADLIVFDEATSALDNTTEREVMSATNNLLGDKTVLIIAHRLSTIKNCDRIVVLDNGEIVGIGSWSDLIRENSLVREISESE